MDFTFRVIQLFLFQTTYQIICKSSIKNEKFQNLKLYPKFENNFTSWFNPDFFISLDLPEYKIHL